VAEKNKEAVERVATLGDRKAGKVTEGSERVEVAHFHGDTPPKMQVVLRHEGVDDVFGLSPREFKKSESRGYYLREEIKLDDKWYFFQVILSEQ
jgi:hypothetical protein